MHHIPPPTDPNTARSRCADGINIISTGTDIHTMEANTNTYLATLQDYLTENNLHLSIPKYSTTLFIPDNHQSDYHPKILINNIQLPLNKLPKRLRKHLGNSLHPAQPCHQHPKHNQKTSKYPKSPCRPDMGTRKFHHFPHMQLCHPPHPKLRRPNLDSFHIQHQHQNFKPSKTLTFESPPITR
jgi:hypothetical protein